jgi:hypothetical protein
MQRRTFLAMVLGVGSGTWLAGCGGGGGGSAPSPVGRGAATGFAFLDAGGALRLFNTAAQGIAAGLTPARGARAQILGGPETTLGTDGKFALTGIEAGLKTLRITPGGAGTPRDIPLTVVPDATLPLGETPVNRAQALEALQAFAAGRGRADLATHADVLVSSTPLPAGVVVEPSLAAGESALTLAQPSWLVYVDRMPGARFGHRTVVALIDAETGAVTGDDFLSWPSLNGASFYAESTINATSPDAALIAPRRPGSGRVASGPAWLSSRSTGRAATCRSADPDTSRTHVLMIQGFGRADFAADMENVDLLLSASPFPKIGTIKKVKTFESAEPTALLLREFAAVRDVCKSGDTFVLFVTSHGVIEAEYPEPTEGDRGMLFKPGPSGAPDQVAPTYRLVLMTQNTFGVSIIVDRTRFKAEFFDPAGLDFSSCKACRIILWIDTCYSGNWIPRLRPQLEALEHKDIVILTSADQTHPAWQVPDAAYPTVVQGQTVTLPSGGLFSQSLLLGTSRYVATGTPETGADSLVGAFSFAFEATGWSNTDVQVDQQSPQLFRRPLEPDDVCGRGDQEVTVR